MYKVKRKGEVGGGVKDEAHRARSQMSKKCIVL